MEDNTKKIMLVTPVLGSLAAVTLGYKYYYPTNSNENESDEKPQEKKDEPKYKTLGMELKELEENKLPKSERTKYRSGFLNSITQTIGFGSKPEKIKMEISEKKDEQWPTFD